jgi:hypothetical protein
MLIDVYLPFFIYPFIVWIIVCGEIQISIVSKPARKNRTVINDLALYLTP